MNRAHVIFGPSRIHFRTPASKFPKAAVKGAAMKRIGRRPEVLRLIVARLADKEAEVRQIAATSLGVLQARAAIPELRLALDDENADVSFAAGLGSP